MKPTIRHESTGEILTIWPTDAKLLSESSIQQMANDIIELINKTQQPNVLLDFQEVKFMSSAALGALIRVNKKCKEFKINLKLCSINPEIMQVFKITKLDKIFAIFPDAPAAYAASKPGLFFRK